MAKYDYLIVGSGLFGATFAYKAKQAGKKCLVIDKRPQLGGNVYCSPTPISSSEGKEHIINVHKYGAHIFHTSNKEVWDFVNTLVEFNRYTNSPVANYKGELYNLPFNMNTFNRLWGVKTPAEAQAKIEEQKAEAVAELNGREPANLEEQALTLVGKDIFEKLIKEYTEKQWGRKCTELPAFIIKRLPVRMIFDNNYFNDKYQGIPVGGYNKLIERMLEGVECITDCDFFHNDIDYVNNSWTINSQSCLKDHWQDIASNLVYTGAIDEYFEYELGRLDWRTVSFKTRIEDTPNYQGNAVVNYTSHNEPYTRVIEHKHFEMFGNEVYECPQTVISEEYSTEYKDGMEQFYPVNDERNNQLAADYRAHAHKNGIIFPEDMISLSSAANDGKANILFGGRLGQYKYFDMAPIIEQVLNMSI
ncbi:MAG: UDP-galactopyranose mutase [Prevotella sp.]|nr:UDP-galactopyranose mutase [Prevotella sp.]